MIVTESYGDYIKTYSNIGVKIRRDDGKIFDEAIDMIAREYTETDITVPEAENDD